MNFTIKFSQFLVIFALITSCHSDKTRNDYCSKLIKNKTGQTIVRLQQQWFPNSGFAGELLAQSKTDSLNGLQIEIINGSDQIVTTNMVLSNQAEFGVAGAEQIMQANEKNANLVIIGVINYQSLACFISKKGRNIITPKNLLHHKIGTMEGTPVDMVYQLLKIKENLTISKDDEIPTGWTLTGFENDLYDVYPAFINDEPITLKLKGIDVDIIHPNYYGVDFIGTVYFCNRKLVENCPEIVQAFINSISEGWELAIKDPKLAITYLKVYDPNINEKKELESLLSGLEYYKGEDGKMLYARPETWYNMAKQIKSIGLIKTFDFKSTVENKFVTWYLSEVKQKNDANAKK